MRATSIFGVFLALFAADVSADEKLRNQCHATVHSQLSSTGALECDNDALAGCLIAADDEFYACERVCNDLYPDDASGYNECRNDCRDTLMDQRNQCYDDNCDAGLSLCKSESATLDVDSLSRYYRRLSIAESCNRDFPNLLSADVLSFFKAEISRFSSTLTEPERQRARISSGPEARVAASSEICEAASEYIRQFDAFGLPVPRSGGERF